MMYERLGTILKYGETSLLGNPRFTEHWIFLQWSRAAGREIDAKTCPYRFTGGTLYVHTINSVWNSHLTALRAELLKELNSHTAPVQVRELRFSVAFPLKGRKKPPEEDNLMDEFRGMELSPQEDEQIGIIASEIKDDSQKALFVSILVKEKKWKKVLQKRGWKACTQCGVLIEKGEICAFCAATDASPSGKPARSPSHPSGS